MLCIHCCFPYYCKVPLQWMLSFWALLIINSFKTAFKKHRYSLFKCKKKYKTTMARHTWGDSEPRQLPSSYCSFQSWNLAVTCKPDASLEMQLSCIHTEKQCVSMKNKQTHNVSTKSALDRWRNDWSLASWYLVIFNYVQRNQAFGQFNDFYASIVYTVVRCLSAIHHCTKTAQQIELVFGTLATLGIPYIMLSKTDWV